MKRILPFLLLNTLSLLSFGQQDACPTIDCGDDITLDCNTTCTDLTADTPANIGETDTYNVDAIAYNPPYPFVGGTSLFVNTDDIWSGVIDLPFDFCFYGGTYDQIIVGANGLLSFDLTDAGGYCPYSFSDAVPSPNLPVNAIFGMYYDLDPSAGGTPDINYQVLGTAPCRTFVVNFSEVRHYSCTTLESTSQIVLYENTNIIDVYIEQHQNCPGWNSGNGIIGIQDATGTNGITAPGYNTSAWTANNIAFRFTPSGASILNINWYDDPGLTNLIGTGNTINVCPDETTTYYAEATYDVCSGPDIVVVDDVTVNTSSTYSLSETHTDVDCNGDCDGTADVTITGAGTTPYVYYLDDVVIPDLSITNLCAGDYTVQVDDNSGCSETIDFTITEPDVLAITETHVDVDCNGDCDGSIDATVTGGTTTYNYSWANGPITEDITGLCAGGYELTVTDDNGCTETITVTIAEPTAITLTPSNTSSSCGVSDGSVSVVANGGSNTFTYSWVDAGNNVVGTTSTVNGLPAGTYTVTVNDGNCTETITTTITDNGSPTLTVDNTTNVSCNGICDGTASITVTDGQAPYTFTWPGGMTVASDNLSASDICAGAYTVTIEDNNGCSVSENFTITEPDVLALSETHVDVDCNGDCDGSIDATVTGGTTTYNYSWANGPITEDITGLCAGDYELTVTDDNGCTETITVTIDEPTSPLTLTINGTDSSPPGANNGSADAIVGGGTAPFTFLWNNSETTEDISNLGPGNYCLTVTDANECQTTECVDITEPTDVTINLVGTNITCFQACDGTATLTITPPGTYNITWTQTGGTVAGDDLSVSGLCPQTISVLVEETTSGATATASITLTEPDEIILDESHTNALCNGVCNGTGDITIVSGGIAPFTYDWGGLGNDPTGANNTGLCPGTHSVTVTDDNGCTETITVTIVEPDQLILDASSVNANCNQPDGEANASVLSGGTGPFTYLWDANAGNQTTPTATGLVQGNYCCTVTDANGCQETICIDVNNNASGNVSVSNINNISCFGLCDGSASITVTGGTPNFSYALNGNALPDGNLTGLCAGDYTVTITDGIGCIMTTDFTLTEPSPVSVLGLGDTIVCIGGCADISAQAFGGNPGYTYDWGVNGTGQQIQVCPNADSQYEVIATDSKGCISAPATVDVTLYSPLSLVLSAIGPDFVCPGESVEIDATPSGGSGVGYSITWDPLPDNGQSPQSPPVIYTPNGDMTITATVSDNCETPDALTTIDIGNHIIPSIDFTADQTEGCEPLAVSFAPAITPAPAIYDWNFGDENSTDNTSFEDTPEHIYQSAGTYDVSLIITTNEGCVDSLTIAQMIEVYPNPTAYFSFGPQPTTILSPEISFNADSSLLANQYAWFYEDDLISFDSLVQTQYIFEDSVSYDITLFVASTEGCIDSITRTVIIDPDHTLFVPTAFSPNGDGTNDEFKPIGIGLHEEYNFWVYDRWGNMIFYTDDYNQAWDGRVHTNCVSCPDLSTRTASQIDTFIWRVKVKMGEDTITEEGIVTLIR